MSTQNNETIDNMILAEADKQFSPKYLATENSDVIVQKTLGKILSAWAHWDISPVAMALYYALIDCNHHELAEKFLKFYYREE